MEKRVLYLTLKKQWYDMIESGEKKEEYREIKPYWIQRLARFGKVFRTFDTVIFRNGYQKNAREMEFEFEFLCNGKGRKEWGAPEENVFIIKLGKKLS